MKGLYTAGPGQPGNEVSINFQGALADIMARTSTKAALMSSIDHENTAFGGVPRGSKGVSHKRSVSDGNTIFQSMMSNRSNN